MSLNFSNAIPDVAQDLQSNIYGSLDRVGMEDVEIAITVADPEGNLSRIPAKLKLYVSLDDPKSKGIHMSRLFLTAQEELERKELNYESLKEILLSMQESHKDISHEAEIEVKFDYMLKRKALLSNNRGWRFYPVAYKASLNKDKTVSFNTSITVTYSSTCPCSAALSRQLIQEEFMKNFEGQNPDLQTVFEWLGKEESQVATPHSQRSYANINLRFTKTDARLDLLYLIDRFEKALATPVQAAVKRIDEQEFAKLNGANFMFIEDAARRIKVVLEEMDFLDGYEAKVEHVESLHPHNAVAIIRS